MDIQTFGEWTVNEKGDVENLKHGIQIDSKMLARSNLLEYLIDEGVDMNHFMAAYLQACKIKKNKSITFNLS